MHHRLALELNFKSEGDESQRRKQGNGEPHVLPLLTQAELFLTEANPR
jgi:hypothetical protein